MVKINDIKLRVKQMEDESRYAKSMSAERRRRMRDLDVGDDFDEAFDGMSQILANPALHRLASAQSLREARLKADKYGGPEDREGTEVSVPRTPGTDNPDEYGAGKKPDSKHWESVPVTETEKAIYYGLHIHSASNPLGLHSHLPGGTPAGAHTHGPQNPLGQHHHKDTEEGSDPKGYQIDGAHHHGSRSNMPTGCHQHCPENFA